MKLNKTNLNKIIKWTSSKFNEFTKAEVIDEILRMQVGEERAFSCGSYGEGAWNGGYHYLIRKDCTKLIIINLDTEHLVVLYGV